MEDNKAESLIDLIIEVSGMYYECANNKADLVKAVKNREK